MGEMRDSYKVLVGKPEGKRTFRRSRHRWEDNIRMDRKEIVSGLWTGCVGFRIGSCEHGNELSGVIKDGEFHDEL
jgi:hypothetical protein